MIETIRAALAAIQALPWANEIGAVAIGLALSWLATQFVKKRVRASGWQARGIAAVLGFAATASLAWRWEVDPVLGFWLAVLVALGAPAAYKGLVAWKGDEWAWVRHLSADPWADDDDGGTKR